MSHKMVSATTLKDWLSRDEAILIDVREPAEHASERIKSATLVPLNKIGTTPLPSHPGRKLVIHCARGMRGENACRVLLASDPELEVYNLEGGIVAWSAAGFPVQTGARRVLPIDRQTQLAIGLCLLVFTGLSLWVNPAFVWGVAFFGAGLTLAGSTGFCGLARVLALMPWNRV
jgi:rhodanese-related sulfurtransferase